MHIIPAIDILEGQCVRLFKGDYSQATYYPVSPLVYAKMLEEAGIQQLHLVDLEGAKSGLYGSLPLLKEISTHTNLQVDTGGGVRNFETVEMILSAGASQVNLGSVAHQQPETVLKWLDELPHGSIIIGADVREGLVSTHGWLAESNTRVEEMIALYLEKGQKQFTVTDISKDGTLKGPAFQLYKDLVALFPDVELIASGGISQITDLDKLAEIGCHGAIVGKALFEGYISMEQLSAWLNLNS